MQFSDPDEKIPTEIDMSEETERMAEQLVSAGYRFEVQRLPSGGCHMDCSKPGSEGPVSLELCDSGFSAEQADRLVREAHSFVFKDEVEFWDEDENPEEFWK